MTIKLFIDSSDIQDFEDGKEVFATSYSYSESCFEINSQLTNLEIVPHTYQGKRGLKIRRDISL